MKVQSYLFYNGRCEEALEFYRGALGAEIEMVMRYNEMPPSSDGKMPPIPPGSENKVMHASFHIGETTLMASDGACDGVAKFDGFALSIEAADAAEAERWFAALGDGGQVRMPLAKTFFSSLFGMVADRFGVCWMIIVQL